MPPLPEPSPRSKPAVTTRIAFALTGVLLCGAAVAQPEAIAASSASEVTAAGFTSLEGFEVEMRRYSVDDRGFVHVRHRVRSAGGPRVKGVELIAHHKPSGTLESITKPAWFEGHRPSILDPTTPLDAEALCPADSLASVVAAWADLRGQKLVQIDRAEPVLSPVVETSYWSPTADPKDLSATDGKETMTQLQPACELGGLVTPKMAEGDAPLASFELVVDPAGNIMGQQLGGEAIEEPARAFGAGTFTGAPVISLTMDLDLPSWNTEARLRALRMVDPTRGGMNVMASYCDSVPLRDGPVLTTRFSPVVQEYVPPPYRNRMFIVAITDPIYPTRTPLELQIARGNAGIVSTAVDIAASTQGAWDMFAYAFDRNGWDDRGSRLALQIQRSVACNGMRLQTAPIAKADRQTKGNGSVSAWLRFDLGDDTYTAYSMPDSVAHEFAHQVLASEVGVNYRTEPGGINEANSDIFGAIYEHYWAASGPTTRASTIQPSSSTSPWLVAQGWVRATPTRPTRSMIDPESAAAPTTGVRPPSAWGPAVASLDPHYASGPINRMFYFLSQGSSPAPPSPAPAPATAPGRTYSTYLPSGMTGLGIDRAARLWYWTVRDHLLLSDNFAALRQRMLAAVAAAPRTPGGLSIAEEQARVCEAFAAVNVGRKSLCR